MTRGGGLSEIQKPLWLLSRPITSSYCMQMEEQERVVYISSDQHSKQTQSGHDLGAKSVYILNSRMNRDGKDTRKVVEFIDSFTPFNDQHSVHNIVTGEIAHESINSEKYLEIGNHTLIH